MHCVENSPYSGCGPLDRAFDNLYFIIFKTYVGVRWYTNRNRPGLWIKGLYRCTLLNISCVNKCQRVTAFAVDIGVLDEMPLA